MADGHQRDFDQSSRSAVDGGAASAQRGNPRAHDQGVPPHEAGAHGPDGHAHVGESKDSSSGRRAGWRAGRGHAGGGDVEQHPGQDRPSDPPARSTTSPGPDVLTNGLADAGPGFRVYRNARDSSAGTAAPAPARAPAARPSDSAPTPPVPKAAPKAKQQARQPQVPARPKAAGAVLAEAVNKSGEKLDSQARATLGHLMERMKEWAQNDYIPDDDINAIDERTLKLAGELLQADAPEFGQLNKYDVTAPGQSAEDVEKAVLKDYEVRFGDFIEKKRGQYNTSEDASLNIGPAAEEDHTRKLFEEHGDQHDTTETRETPKNIIRIDDPEDALGRQDTGVLKPADIQEKFLAPGMICDDNPGKFLTNPAMLQLSSIRNFSAWINRYRLMRGKEFWSEKQLLEDFSEDALKYVNKKYSFHRLPSSLRFVFFVENPLFVFCVFGRRQDKENTKKYLKAGEKDLKPAHRKYAWAGHLFCVGRDGSNDPVELPPSTFQFNPPTSLYSNSGNAEKKDDKREGWE